LTSDRQPATPDMPTLAEQGIPVEEIVESLQERGRLHRIRGQVETDDVLQVPLTVGVASTVNGTCTFPARVVLGICQPDGCEAELSARPIIQFDPL
jgi:hypothetical protein